MKRIFAIKTDRLFDISLFLYFIFFILEVNQGNALIEIGRTIATIMLLISGVLLFGGSMHRFRVSTCFLWYFVFVVYALASSLWAKNPETVFEIAITFLRIIIVIFFASIRIKNNDDIRRILEMFKYAVLIRNIVVFLLMLGAVSITGFFQYRFGDVVGYNSNTNAIYSVFALLIVIDEIRNVSNRKTKYAEAAILLLVIFLAGSKKGILGLLVGISLYLLFNNSGAKKTRALVIIFVIIFATYEAITTIPYLYQSIGYRFEQMFDTLKGQQSGTSTIERMNLIEQGLIIWKNNKLFGVGLNNFSIAQGISSTYRGVYAHCNYVELLADLGIIGTLIYYIYPLLICLKYKIKNSVMLLLKTLVIVELIYDIGLVSYNDVFIILILSLAYFAYREQNITNVKKMGK